MKKRKRLLMVSVVILLIVTCLLYQNSKPKTGLLKEYERYIKDYNEKIKIHGRIADLGYTGTKEEALEKAKKFWTEDSNYESMMSLMPFYVEYDEDNKLWHIYNIPEYFIGEAHLIIRKRDGRVLACWVGN